MIESVLRHVGLSSALSALRCSNYFANMFGFSINELIAHPLIHPIIEYQIFLVNISNPKEFFQKVYFDSLLGSCYLKLRLYLNKFRPYHEALAFRCNGCKMRESITPFFFISDDPGRVRHIFDTDINISDTLLARFYQSRVYVIKVLSLCPASKNRRQELGATGNELHREQRLTRS